MEFRGIVLYNIERDNNLGTNIQSYTRLLY